MKNWIENVLKREMIGKTIGPKTTYECVGGTVKDVYVSEEGGIVVDILVGSTMRCYGHTLNQLVNFDIL